MKITVCINEWIKQNHTIFILFSQNCLKAMGKTFHPECFVCAYCGKIFANSPFYLEDGLPYCEEDWNELFTTKCVSCGFPIEAGDRWVEALNNNYHSQCFNCTLCKKNLEGKGFFVKAGKPFCKSHARMGIWKWRWQHWITTTKSAKFVHRNVGIFSTTHIFFCFFILRENKIHQDFSWIILNKQEETSLWKKLRRCVIFLFTYYYTYTVHFPKKRPTY